MKSKIIAATKGVAKLVKGLRKGAARKTIGGVPVELPEEVAGDAAGAAGGVSEASAPVPVPAVPAAAEKAATEAAPVPAAAKRKGRPPKTAGDAASVPAVAETAAPAPAPAVFASAIVTGSPVPSASGVTTLVAINDVGWGNTIYVRGEGGGLSWDYGVPMTNRSASEWVWVTDDATPVVTFKFLLNDIFWENGENRQLLNGEIYTAAPVF